MIFLSLPFLPIVLFAIGALGETEAPKSETPSIIGIACRMLGWDDQCDNFVQASVIGIGAALRTEFQDDNPNVYNQTYSTLNAFQCMLADEKSCEQTVTEDKIKCAWCDNPPMWVEKFGKGSCMLEPLKALGCTLAGEAMFKPMNSTGLVIPTSFQQATCAMHNKSPEDCNKKHGDFECQYCDMPDVYGWRPYTGLCLQKHLVGNVGDKLACDALKRIPPGAVNILLQPDSEPTEPDSGTETESSTSSPSNPEFSTKPDSAIGPDASSQCSLDARCSDEIKTSTSAALSLNSGMSTEIGYSILLIAFLLNI